MEEMSFSTKSIMVQGEKEDMDKVQVIYTKAIDITNAKEDIQTKIVLAFDDGLKLSLGILTFVESRNLLPRPLVDILKKIV